MTETVAPLVSRLAIRKIVAGTLLFVALATLGWALIERQRTVYLRSSVESRQLNDATIQAVELKVRESTTIYQITAACIVTLWGLILAPRTAPRIALQDPEAVMAVAATIMLGAAVTWHYLYTDAIFQAYRVAGATSVGSTNDRMPDVFRMQFHHLLIFQRWFFAGGFAMAVVTLFSASRS